jgi:formamidopyrimidine-DNA glycosylase
MPELPEVEITRRRIEAHVLGRRIAVVETTRDSAFFLTRPAVLRRRLRGRRLTALNRLGKYLLARLDGGERLLLHLGMTGQIFVAGVPSVRLLSADRGGALEPGDQTDGFRSDAHTHLRLRFADRGPDLVFRDVRKLGKVQLLAAGRSSRRLDALGPDALAARADHFVTACRRRRVAVKSLLLDQGVIAGVGNIYADEALFLARIRPLRRAHRLTSVEARRLFAAVQRVLRRSLEREDGELRTRVYGRAGEACPRCRTPIERRRLGGRSTHFCPACQR